MNNKSKSIIEKGIFQPVMLVFGGVFLLFPKISGSMFVLQRETYLDSHPKMRRIQLRCQKNVLVKARLNPAGRSLIDHPLHQKCHSEVIDRCEFYRILTSSWGRGCELLER